MATKKISTKEIAHNLFVDINQKESLEFHLGGKLYYKGEPLTDNQIQDLASQAGVVKDLEVTEMLFTEMEHVACKMMYYEGEDSLESLKFGKAMLYTIDVLRKKLDNLSRLKKKEN